MSNTIRKITEQTTTGPAYTELPYHERQKLAVDDTVVVGNGSGGTRTVAAVRSIGARELRLTDGQRYSRKTGRQITKPGYSPSHREILGRFVPQPEPEAAADELADEVLAEELEQTPAVAAAAALRAALEFARQRWEDELADVREDNTEETRPVWFGSRNLFDRGQDLQTFAERGARLSALAHADKWITEATEYRATAEDYAAAVAKIRDHHIGRMIAVQMTTLSPAQAHELSASQEILRILRKHKAL